MKPIYPVKNTDTVNGVGFWAALGTAASSFVKSGWYTNLVKPALDVGVKIGTATLINKLTGNNSQNTQNNSNQNGAASLFTDVPTNQPKPVAKPVIKPKPVVPAKTVTPVKKPVVPVNQFTTNPTAIAAIVIGSAVVISLAATRKRKKK